MRDVFICAYFRTPFGKFGGALSSVRPDDLAAIPLQAIRDQLPNLDLTAIDDVILGNTNQAGEDNRNVARMALLLAGYPIEVPGVTLNRLCGSGMDSVATAARAIRSGEADLVIAGGVESMTRAPFVMGKAETAYARQAEIFDTTIGWRFVNPRLHEMHGSDLMPVTAENLAEQFSISREDQDRFAEWSQAKAIAAKTSGRFAQEICPVPIHTKKGASHLVSEDEHPRVTTLESLSKLKAPFKAEGGTVTAGNASGINDGAVALLLASETAINQHGLTPLARVLGAACAGVAPRIMGFGPVPAVQKLLKKTGLALDQFEVLEFNEAFAAQALACTRALSISDTDDRLNRNGGAIAIGHPLGASGARLVGTSIAELHNIGGRYALTTMCIGLGQGIAMAFEKC